MVGNKDYFIVYICLSMGRVSLSTLSFTLTRTYVFSSACLITLLYYLPTFGNRHMHFYHNCTLLCAFGAGVCGG